MDLDLNPDPLYQLVVMCGLWAVYLGLLQFFPVFFSEKRSDYTQSSLYALILIGIFHFAVFLMAWMIPDYGVGNRVLHVGGGFVSFLTVLLAAKDSRVRMSQFQLLVFGVLITTTLGVLNELLECWLQVSFDFISTNSIEDTWFDLMSNTVGIFFGCVTLMPFFAQKPNTHNIRP